ncbi:MAG: IS200/IS605 family transposase [Desulfobulbus sp.]|nr:IS200/IS605 family transposase [Desulfobulbus sp.]
MSRFSKLSPVLWCCQYHIVWVPKYRYRLLRGPVGEEVHNCIHVFAGRLGCVIFELNVQQDHVHLLVKIPPKVSISEFMGSVKEQTAIRVLKSSPISVNAPIGATELV